MNGNHKINVPKDITPLEFFTRFVPENFHRRVKDCDMTEYRPLNLTLQFRITDIPDGEFGVKVIEGTRIEAFHGKMPNPQITYEFPLGHFREAVEGKLPWVPLEMAYNPEALRKGLTSGQVREQMELIGGVKGQAVVSVKREDDRVVDVKMNFHGADEPAIVFNVTHKVVEGIEKNEYTVMEAFMAGKIKLAGPLEFAMHVMALIPEREEQE
ncbi:MAG: SCP2 sterol-binding domain-containing protein [Nitrospirae bacterium]|nr:SCP2 sterol-binding domain-containing protein [Nitrospirota bacterium]